MARAPCVYLASKSPRRRALLEQIGVRYRAVPVDIDETPRVAEPPADFVLRLALTKAQTVAARRHKADQSDDGVPVLAADTAVVVAGRILVKPRDRAEGLAMMELLSGRTHEVLTAVALVADGSSDTALSRSLVRFREVTQAEASTYWDTGEPVDKAGGYAIQGLGAVFVAELSGSYSGVMGLPVFETAELLSAAGIHVLTPTMT